MSKKRLLLNSIVIVALLAGFLSIQNLPIFTPTQVVKAATATSPVVAIHVSELTQALESLPAVAPTPTGTGYTGYEWFLTSWHYFVMYESLKVAFDSDGTPYKTVSDADIANGALMEADGVTPKYPIVFSLASEAVNNNEIQPLRDYVNAGGFLFVGSSSFTRNTNGTTRGDFALASEMGLSMTTNTLLNWTTNASITHTTNHRLVSHIPTGTVNWDMQANAEDVAWNGSTPVPQQLWQTTANGAEILATGSGYPLIATHGYGAGRFIYHAMLNPIVGAGSYDTGMYAYTIVRSAVEWAFEAANLPILKRSPWPYAYDAALIVRHDLESDLGRVAFIEGSAQYEQSIGAKGEYYFCTGALRTAGDQTALIASMKRAVSLYGATIGSHNGGFPNLTTVTTSPGAYDYWHWGPDTMIDATANFSTSLPPPYNAAPYTPYTSGYAYARDSIKVSFEDLEGWLAGTDNGRSGCGAVAGSCPRTWVAPYINSGRDRSFKILAELGAVVMGEQKVSPFPHWTLSFDPANSLHRYNHVNLPLSDWYIGSVVSQSQENGHSQASIQAMVDFFYDKGYLINAYGHESSTGSLMKVYVDRAISKDREWATNSVGIYDWWVVRDHLAVTEPLFSKTGGTSTVSVSLSGTNRDPGSAVELVLPNWSSGAVADLVVRLNGAVADPSEFRTTNYGIKVRVGTSVTSVSINYQALEGWVQTDWIGGEGQVSWSDPTRYESATTSINDAVAGQFSLAQTAGGTNLFSDDFNRELPPAPDPVPFTWTVPAPAGGNRWVANTIGGSLNTSLSQANQYAYAYKDKPDQPLGDYTIETDIQFPAGFTGGGGVFGRLNPATGAQYAIWIYPTSNTMRLINYDIWNDFAWTPALATNTALPVLGNTWHHLKVVFSGTNIQVYLDAETSPRINYTDPANLYSAGFVGIDYWDPSTYGPSYNNFKVTDNTSSTTYFEDTFGEAYAPGIPPWTISKGSWTITDNALRSTSGAGGGDVYSDIYYTPTDPTSWTNYSVEARVQYPTGTYGGLAGRWNPVTGNRYTAWVYTATNTISLLDYSGPITWASLANVSIPTVGTGWHVVKMDFSGNHIRVYWDTNLVIDITDTVSPFLSGGIGIDTAVLTGAYLIAADDVVVTGRDQHQSSGTLISSAFDGGVGARYYDISWDASVPASTSLCVQTRTADAASQLVTATWSDCYANSGSSVTSADRRWIQYQVTMETTDPSVTPIFYENGITYTPGSYLPQSALTNNSQLSGDSQTSVSLSGTLLDELNAPIVGRTVSFTLDGLPPVTGITNSSGVATTSLTLDIAPGVYPLAIAFETDNVYGPSSVQSSFTVTESWAEWIQDTSIDFSGGTSACVDVTTDGSLILHSQLLGEGEETGPFTLGDETYGHRHRVYIDNPNATVLPSGYSVKLVVDTVAMVTAHKLLENGNDLRVVRIIGDTTVELDRMADTAFNSAATEIWFKTQAAIPADGRDSSYYIYYGKSDAGVPPANPANIFALYDGFDDQVVNSTLWTSSGTVTESLTGWAQLAAGSDLISKQTFTYAKMEAHIETMGTSGYMWWGWEDGVADAANFIIFEQLGAGSFVALLRNDGGSYLPSLELSPQPTGGITLPHTYAAEWRPSQARWLIDGTPAQSASIGVPDSAMQANFYAGAAYNVDWVRVRLLTTLEPVVALASPYQGYVSSCSFTSAARNTGGAIWKYLVWEENKPAGTNLILRLRTAVTEAGLASATWYEYSQSGMLLLATNHPAAAWVQYQAILSTNDALITPELLRVIVYYESNPTGVDLNYFRAARTTAGVQLTWETVNEATLAGFNLYRRELDGKFEKINAELIPPEKGGQPDGYAYLYLDETAALDTRYEYRLEVIETNLEPSASMLAPYWPFSIQLPIIQH